VPPLKNLVALPCKHRSLQLLYNDKAVPNFHDNFVSG